MKPFSAWIGVSKNGTPFEWGSMNWYELSRTKSACQNSPADPQRVLVIEDTPDNRHKVGMK